VQCCEAVSADTGRRRRRRKLGRSSLGPSKRAFTPDPFAAEAAPTILNQHRRTAFRPELFSEIIRLRLNGIHLFFKDIRLAWNFAAVSDSIVLSALVTRLFTSLSRRATRLPQAGCFFLPRGTPNGCASGLFYCTSLLHFSIALGL